MTTSQILTYLTVCRSLSFTETARHLNMTQSAVSRQISGLESELGIRLLSRNNNILQLTAAGERVRDGFLEITRVLDQTTEEARRIDSGYQGVLRIGQLADQTVSTELGDAIRHLTEASPVNVTITRLEHQQLFQDLDQGRIDIADAFFQTDSVIGNFEQFIYQPTQNMCLALRKELAEDVPLRLTRQELIRLSHRIPIYLPARSNLVDYKNSEDPIHDIPGLQLSFRDFDSIVLMTSAGLCATMINPDNILARDPHITLLEPPFVHSVSRAVVWKKGNRNPMVSELISLMRQSTNDQTLLRAAKVTDKP